MIFESLFVVFNRKTIALICNELQFIYYEPTSKSEGSELIKQKKLMSFNDVTDFFGIFISSNNVYNRDSWTLDKTCKVGKTENFERTTTFTIFFDLFFVTKDYIQTKIGENLLSSTLKVFHIVLSCCSHVELSSTEV